MALLTLIVVLGTWVVLTALSQTNGRVAQTIRSHDHFGLIPRWTFFAPNPGTSDYVLVYWDRYLDGSLSEPHEVELIAPRRLTHIFWNPDKRAQKVVIDSLQSLLALARQLGAEGLPTTLPYIVVAGFILNLPTSPLVEARQFAVFEREGYESQNQPRMIVSSMFHRLEAAVAESR